MLTLLKMRVMISDFFFWPEEMLFRPCLFCGRAWAVVYVKGRGRYDHCKDKSLGRDRLFWIDLIYRDPLGPGQRQVGS